MTRAAQRTAAFLLLAPLGGLAALLLGLVGMSLLAQAPLPIDLQTHMQTPVATVLVAALGVGFALLARHRTRSGVLTGPLQLAVALALPVAVVVVLLTALDNPRKAAGAAPGLALWALGMVLVLWLAARAAARGQVRQAWWIGALGAIVVADLSIVLTVVTQTLPETVISADGGQTDGVARIWAPLWLFALYTGSTFGLPGPTDWEISQILDITLDAHLFLAVTPYLLAYAITAARRTQLTGQGPVSDGG